MKENKELEKEKLEKEILINLLIVKKLVVVLLIILTIMLTQFLPIFSNIKSNSNFKLKNADIQNIDYSFNSSEFYDWNNNINQIVNYSKIEKVNDTYVNAYDYDDFTNNDLTDKDTDIDFINSVDKEPSADDVSFDIASLFSKKSLFLNDNSETNRIYAYHTLTDSYKTYINFSFFVNIGESRITLKDDTNNLIMLQFNTSYFTYYDGANFIIITNQAFNLDIFYCVINLYLNETALVSIYNSALNLITSISIDFLDLYIDGLDKIEIRSFTVKTKSYFREFFIDGENDNGYIIFDFRNLNIPNPASWSLYTYLKMNISGFCGTGFDYGYWGNDTHAYLNKDFYNESGGRTLFFCFYTILDYSATADYMNIFFIHVVESLIIYDLKAFGFCFLRNAEYYGPLAPIESPEINTIAGLNSSLFDASGISFNNFYINNTTNDLYYHVDFLNNYKNYLNFFWKLFIKNSFHKRTFLTFSTERNPSLISNSYLILSHWGTMGYYNQSINLPDNVINTRIQLASNNYTSDSFEMIYFNVSDLANNQFTGYSVNGYISNFVVEYRIITLYDTALFLTILPALLIFIFIPLALYTTLGRKFLPILCLFSNLILFIFGMIPLYVFVIIFISLGFIFIINEKETNIVK